MDLNNYSTREFIDFLCSAEQSLIDKLYNDDFELSIKDFILKRAFLKRYRFETIEKDFWISELNERENNKLLGIKRKNRSKEELYQEIFCLPKQDIVYHKIEGYELVSLFEIKGVYYDGRISYLLNNAKEDDILILEKDKYNGFDKNAVEIFHKNKSIGFVPRESAVLISRAMKYKHVCTLFAFGKDDDFTYGSFLLYVEKI